MSNPLADLRRVLSAGGLYAVASFAQRGVSFFLLPIYTRHIEPAEYGMLELLGALTSVLYACLLVGLPSALTKVYHRDCRDDHERSSVLSTSLLLDLPFLILGGGILFAFSEQVGIWLIGEPGKADLIRLVVATGVVSSLVAIVLSSFRAQERAVAFSTLSLIQFVLAMVLNVVLVVRYDLGLRGVLWGNLVSNVVALPLTLAVARRGSTLAFERRLVRPLLAFGALQIPVMLSSWVINLSDRYVLRLHRALEDVAVYGVGYKFGMVLQLALVWPFQLAWPAVAFSISKRPGHQRTYARVLTYLFALLILGVLGLSLGSRAVVPPLVGEGYREAYRVVPLVALAYAFNGIHYCTSPGVHVGGRTRVLTLFSAAAAVINLGLNLIFVPQYGMWGAMVSTVAAFLFLAVATTWLSRRVHPVDYEYGRLLKVLLAGAATYALAIFAEPGGWITAFLWHLAASLIVYPLLLLALGWLEADEKRHLAELWPKIRDRLLKRKR